MQLRTQVSDPLAFKSMIGSTGLLVPDELDDLNTLINQLRREQVRYRNAPMHEVMAAIRRGEVRHTQVIDQDLGGNRLVRGFFLDFFARLGGAKTAPGEAQTLFIERFALGTNYASVSFNQPQLGKEIYRAAPDEFYDDGNTTFYATTYLKKSDGNPLADTLVDSSTTTVITVDDGSEFSVNDRCQVQTDLETYFFTVKDVTSNDLEVKDILGGSFTEPVQAFDPADIPQNGNRVVAMHAEGACFLGGDADASPNTGNMMNRRRIQRLKDSSISRLYDYILACASVD